MKKEQNSTKTDSLITFIKRYKVALAILFLFSLLSNSTTLLIPKLIASTIDSFTSGTFRVEELLPIFLVAVVGVFIFTVIQTLLGVYISEKIAKDLRDMLVLKISKLSYSSVAKITSDKLLTNLTSDVEAIKRFISEGLVYVFSAIVLLVGSIFAVLAINVQLAIPVLLILPIIVVTSGFIFSKLGKNFGIAQSVTDALNRIIGENIMASALVRVLHSQETENTKFNSENQKAKNVGLKILNLFAAFFPFISLIINAAVIFVLWQGGVSVINNTLSYGDFVAFFSYIQTLVFPIIILGFISSSIGQAFASYARLSDVLSAEDNKDEGTVTEDITGSIDLKNISLTIDEKPILKDITVSIPAGSRTAIIGPTASGKTQLLQVMINLIHPDSGDVLIDNKPIESYLKQSLYSQLGVVFQDSILFNTTLRENIAFGDSISEEQIYKAIETAELATFIESLPDGLNTIISERGTSLSGGQKQRLTLARALALNPKILFLDDFTARVDQATEKKIFENLKKNYPTTTIVMIAQKIASVIDFNNIVLLMEGELLAQGTHDSLLKHSLEYKLIFESQQSTE